MSIDKNDLTYIPSEIGNKERFINDGDSRIGGITKICTCNTTTGDSTVEGPHHDRTCPMYAETGGDLVCYLCGHIVEKQSEEEGHWYSNHYNTCSLYGVCDKCKANIGNGEPHKNSCMFTKCTCGNDGKPGPEHDPSCPKYVKPPTCKYCGENGDDIKNHLIWCPNYDGLKSYNTCVLCGENDGHKSTCVYGKKQAPKSDKMCTTEEVYDHLYKYFKSKKKIDNKEYCELTKTWKSFPSHAIQDIYIGSYNFEDIIRDNEQLFQLHQITYSLAPVYATLLIKTNNSRPDTVNQIEQRIIKFDYSYSTDWDLDVPVPTEEVFINLEVIYYNKARDKWLKHYTKQRLTPGNGSFSVTVNSNSDDVASFSSNWIQLKVNDKIINLNDPNIIPYNKQYDMHAAIEYIPDYTKPEGPPTVNPIIMEINRVSTGVWIDTIYLDENNVKVKNPALYSCTAYIQYNGSIGERPYSDGRIKTKGMFNSTYKLSYDPNTPNVSTVSVEQLSFKVKMDDGGDYYPDVKNDIIVLRTGGVRITKFESQLSTFDSMKLYYPEWSESGNKYNMVSIIAPLE